MGGEQIEAARALLAQPGVTVTVTGVAAHLGVSRTTINCNMIGPTHQDVRVVLTWLAGWLAAANEAWVGLGFPIVTRLGSRRLVVCTPGGPVA